MLDDAFQSSTDTVLNDLAQRPRPPVPQAPSFSMWGLMKAPTRGVTAGAAQGIGSTADVLGANTALIGLADPAGGADPAEDRRQRPGAQVDFGAKPLGQHPRQVLGQAAAGDMGQGMDAGVSPSRSVDNNFIGHLQALSGTRLLMYVYVRCGSAFRGSTIMCLTKIIVV